MNPVAPKFGSCYICGMRIALASLCICLLAGCGGCAPNGRVVNDLEDRGWAAVSAQTNAANAAEETE